MKRVRANLLAVVALVFFAAVPGAADVRLPAVIGDHMVLQRDEPIVLWGWAEADETVTANLARQEATCVADGNGRWKLTLPPMPAGGPYELRVSGRNTIVLGDVLIGDVWLCSGQSNMEWPVEKAARAEEEIRAANHPRLRLFTLPRTKAVGPRETCDGQWAVCDPQSVGAFSATAYYFGRELRKSIDVPIGLVHSSHGGTPAEAWMRWEALERVPEVRPLLEQTRAEAESWTSGAVMNAYRQELTRWEATRAVEAANPVREVSAVTGGVPDEGLIRFTNGDWHVLKRGLVGEGQPGELSTSFGLGGGDFVLHAELSIERLEGSSSYFILGNSHFGFADSTWGRMFVRGPVFGEKVAFIARTEEHLRDDTPFALDVRRQGDVLTIAIDGRTVHNVTCGPGAIGAIGICPGKARITLNELKAEGRIDSRPRPTVAFARPIEPTDPRLRHFHPGALFNGMIAPLLPLRLRGVVWYQGESNHERAEQYRALFLALIESWRAEWNSPQLPFLFVQIANYGQPVEEPGESDWAELREAQTLALRLPRTAMAVAIDVGEAQHIHPADKQAVGARLALAARAVVHGEDVVFSGPAYRSMRVEDGSIRLEFDHVGGGLVARGGALRYFAIAGPDRNFKWAEARIENDTVVVSHPEITDPVAVRYAWAANPEGCNLYNREGLPAGPFRTDDWPGVSAGKRTR